MPPPTTHPHIHDAAAQPTAHFPPKVFYRFGLPCLPRAFMAYMKTSFHRNTGIVPFRKVHVISSFQQPSVGFACSCCAGRRYALRYKEGGHNLDLKDD